MSDGKPDGVGPNPEGMPTEEGAWSEFLMGIRESTESIGKDLKWDEDWMPMVMVDGIFPADMPGLEPEKAGQQGRLFLGIGGDIMNNEEQKERLAEIMFGIAIKMRATSMVFLSTVWMSILPMTEDDYERPGETQEEHRARVYEAAKKHGPPSEDPNRKERLMILSVCYGGGDDGTKFIFADIKREEGHHPVLHDWKLCDQESMDMLGRFPEAIYKGLKLARMIRAAEANEEEAK